MEIPYRPNVLLSPSRSKLPLVIILFAVLILIISAAINYLGIFPKPKTLTPQNQAPYSKIQIPKKPACPLQKNLCTKGEAISLPATQPVFKGLGYQNIASGTAILAVMDGKYGYGVSVNNKGEKNTILTIVNESGNMEVNYEFKGKAYIPVGATNGTVKQGDTIGWLSKESLEQGLFSRQYSLIVSAHDIKTKEFINLDPSDLSKNSN